MATSKVAMTEGSGKNAATYSFSEDTATKEIQRVSINNSSGSEVNFNSNGQATKANSAPVVVAGPGIGTQTNVSASASDGTILAANSARSAASVYNDSAAILYVLAENNTSSTTKFSAKLYPDDYWEAPAGYTGIIKGIWASAVGSARVTEYV